MNPKDKIIVALDVPTVGEAVSLADTIGEVGALKVGLELITSCGAPQAVTALSKKGRVFLDAKFKDIPNTVAGAARAAVRAGAWMFNLHAMGGADMMKAAKEAAEDEAEKLNVKRPLIIAVTLLTSIDAEAARSVGFDSVNSESVIKSLVVRLAVLAKSAGLDGVVASPEEIEPIKKACGADFLVVTPGIRPKWSASNDQKRITTPAEAIKRGADYIVIGRPITSPPKEVGGPREAIIAIIKELEGVNK